MDNVAEAGEEDSIRRTALAAVAAYERRWRWEEVGAEAPLRHSQYAAAACNCCVGGGRAGDGDAAVGGEDDRPVDDGRQAGAAGARIRTVVAAADVVDAAVRRSKKSAGAVGTVKSPAVAEARVLVWMAEEDRPDRAQPSGKYTEKENWLRPELNCKGSNFILTSKWLFNYWFSSNFR